MTSSISSSMSMQRMSPLAMLQKNLTSEISSGKINSADKDALSAALETIDDAMEAGRSSTEKPSKEGGKAKVESLIDQQVASGALTEDQASELKQLFEDTFAGGPKGAGGPQGGPPPGPPPSEEEDDESTLTISGSSTDIAAMLEELIKKFAEQSSSVSYGSTGTTSTSSAKSLFLDITA